MPLPQMTTRRLMIVVAVAGIVIAILDLSRRRARYDDMARSAAAARSANLRSLEMLERGELMPNLNGVSSQDVPAAKARLADLYRGHIAWLQAMEEKYRRAARRPWLSVPAPLPD